MDSEVLHYLYTAIVAVVSTIVGCMITYWILRGWYDETIERLEDSVQTLSRLQIQTCDTLQEVTQGFRRSIDEICVALGKKP